MGVRGKGYLTPPETPFHADSNELLCVSIALILMEIWVDFDRGPNINKP
jgi:hypothetical protein